MLSKKVTRWRNSFFHRKCKYCVHYQEEKDIWSSPHCNAKDCKIENPWYSFGYKNPIYRIRPFCTLFEVKDGYEKPKVPSNSTSGESWSWEGYPGTGPRG